MKKTLAFFAIAALSLVALAAQAFPAVAGAVHGVIAFIGPDGAMGLSLIGSVAATVTRDRAYVGTFPVCTQPDDSDVELVAIPITFPTAAPVANDTHALCKLLPGIQVIDFDLYLDDLDSSGAPTAALSVGELAANLLDINVTYQAGITLAQTGGIARFAAASEAASLRAVGAATLNTERVIGLKWTTAAATYTAGKTGLLVLRILG